MLWLLLCTLIVANAQGDDLKSKLLDPEWHEVIDNGGMHIGSGRTKRFVEINANMPNEIYQPCVLPSGEAGHCKNLRYCVLKDFTKDITKFMDYLCVINLSSIGVCCPDYQPGLDGLAGDLPATAPRDEQYETIMKIERAENRGCGLSTRPQGRVTGARPAIPREWPWMASITPENFEQYCGGVLITDRHVLTAAHCTRRWTAEELTVRLGEYDFRRTNDSRSFDFQVVEIRQHVDYEVATYKNDIAILKLHRPAVFSTYVWPICLPPLGLELDNQVGVVIGWGTQWYGGPHSTVLMEVSIPIWNQQICMNSFTDSIFETNLCAGEYNGSKDSCQGDSGGPLMYQMPSGRWAVIGIVSWGLRCGEPKHPGIYTRVDKFLPWIVDNVQF